MECCLVATFGVGVNQVGYGFGLCEVKLSVQKSPLRKFPWTCQTRSHANKEFDHLLYDVGGTVRGDLDYILFGKGTWSHKKRHQHLVENLLPIAKCAEVDGMRSLFFQVFSIKDFVADADGIFAR